MSLMLFPHSFVPQILQKRIVDIFGQLTICYPWFLESPSFMQEGIDDGHIKILFPPEELKPSERIQKMIVEYHQWIKRNQGWKYAGVLQNELAENYGENATWEIRQALRQISNNDQDNNKEMALKWHIILHLAKAIEEQRLEAEAALNKIRHMRPLLDGSVEEAGDIHQLVGDLSPFEQEPSFTHFHFTQISEAWFGLFGDYLREGDTLLTFNRHFMEYLSEKWDDLCIDEKSLNRQIIPFKIPDLTHLPQGEQTALRQKYHMNTRLERMKDLIFDLEGNPARNLAGLDALSDEFIGAFPMDISRRNVMIHLKYLSPISGQGLSKGEAVLQNLSHRTLLFVELNPKNG
ncbi:MAG: hypothetical protein JW932_18420 [Deltaproteobacteria bacterium]|nr:hypothetical protein [Deltaproteobacteria bacterium]